jgi:hypothetical protein
MKLGDIEIEGVRDGTAYLPPGFFGKADGGAHAAILGEDGRIQLPIAGFVVHTGGQCVLMDAGMGPVSMESQPDRGRPVKLEGGGLPGSLAAVGVAPADIDIVLPVTASCRSWRTATS